MELSQISSWGFGLNLKDTASSLDNSSLYDRIKSSLTAENEYYGLSLIKLGQANTNERMNFYILIVVVLIVIMIFLNLVF